MQRAPIFAAWQYPIMGDSVFDRQLVRAKMKETKTSQAEMARHRALGLGRDIGCNPCRSYGGPV